MPAKSREARLTKAMNKANVLYAESQAARRTSDKYARKFVEFARQCGAALLEARDHYGYGSWKPYVQEHFEGSYETAHAYMKLAEIGDEDWTAILREIEGDPECNISIREIKRREQQRKKGANEPTPNEWELQVRQARRGVARTLLHLIKLGCSRKTGPVYVRV